MTTPEEARELLANHAWDLRYKIKNARRGQWPGYVRRLKFIADAIDKFLSGEAKSLDAAFGVKPRRGAPNKHAEHMDIARPIYSLMRQGRSWKEIYNELDIKDDRAARRAIKECLNELMAEEIAAIIEDSNSPD